MAIDYTTPSEYELKSITLVNYRGEELDITPSMISFSIEDSIYTNFSTASLLFKSRGDLSQILPLNGEETVIFEYASFNNTVVKRTFRTYDFSQGNENGIYAVTLSLISPEAFTNQSNLISRSFVGKTVNEITSELYKSLESQKKLLTEESIGRHHIVIPRWTVAKTINWMSSFAQSPKNLGGTWLFYETDQGFNHFTFETLLSKNPIDEYFEEITKLKDTGRNLNAIRSMKVITNCSNSLSSINEGMLGSTYYYYDNISKTFSKDEYNYSEEFSKFEHLNSQKLVTDNFSDGGINSRVSILPSTKLRESSQYFIDSGEAPSSTHVEATSRYRTSIYSQVESRQFEIVFNGDTRIKAGEVVNMRFADRNAEKEKDEYTSGNMLLTTCTHNFTQYTYTVKSRCVMDSVPNKLESGL